MKKGKKKSNNNKVIIIAAVVVIVIICIIFLLMNGGNKKENNDKKDNTVVEDKGHKIEEKDIVDAYGMSKEDAINLVKKLFNSDNFEFSAEVNEDAKYVVTAKNTISDTSYKYLVDPINQSFYEIR